MNSCTVSVVDEISFVLGAWAGGLEGFGRAGMEFSGGVLFFRKQIVSGELGALRWSDDSGCNLFFSSQYKKPRSRV